MTAGELPATGPAGGEGPDSPASESASTDPGHGASPSEVDTADLPLDRWSWVYGLVVAYGLAVILILLILTGLLDFGAG